MDYIRFIFSNLILTTSSILYYRIIKRKKTFDDKNSIIKVAISAVVLTTCLYLTSKGNIFLPLMYLLGFLYLGVILWVADRKIPKILAVITAHLIGIAA